MLLRTDAWSVSPLPDAVHVMEEFLCVVSSTTFPELATKNLQSLSLRERYRGGGDHPRRPLAATRREGDPRKILLEELSNVAVSESRSKGQFCVMSRGELAPQEELK
jgi:hypothetical protein